jgi:heat shock protein HslJ
MKNILLFLTIIFSTILSCQGPQQSTSSLNSNVLAGTWKLQSAVIPGYKFEELFSERVPEITISIPDSTVSGNSSCNSFTGKFEATNGTIAFSKNMAMTRMFCQGDGERVFIELLAKTDTYRINADTILQLRAQDLLLMEFVRKK